MRLSIFYSWQSDSPAETNRTYLWEMLKKIKEHMDIDIIDAPSARTGSEYVPNAIITAIESSDIFLCDITTINSKCVCDNTRRTPNPNVMYELGYAAAVLGWQRIVLVFNESIGNFPDDLPFDFKGHYIHKYKHSDDLLRGKLIADIQKIAQDNPQKIRVITQSPEQIKRTKDISIIHRIMSTIYLSSIDDFLSNMPSIMPQEAVHYFENFNANVRSSEFHLYNKTLEEIVFRFLTAWDQTLSYSTDYTPLANYYKLVSKDRKTHHIIATYCKSMHEAYWDLLHTIREEYLEIDLDETNKIAWNEYQLLQNKFTKAY